MLNKDSMLAAVPLATVLDNNNLVLTPQLGSPLEVLVNATRFDLNDTLVNEDGSFNMNLETIDYLANAKDPVLNICKHDVALDEITEVVSNAIKGHMNFAKNVVAPAVESLVLQTTEKLKAINVSTLLGLEVITHYPPKPMLNSGLEAIVRAFDEVSLDDPTMNLSLPSLTGAEVVELMKSGSGNLDTAISEWAAIKGDSFFSTLWENMFQQKQAGLNDREVITFNNYLYKNSNDVDNALAVFLLTRKLMDNPLPETEMNLNTFNKTIVEFRNQSGNKLCRAFDEIAKIDKLQILVRENNNRTVIVNGNIYAKWIEAGGSNEILFGNLLANNSYVTVENINANIEALKAKWDHYYNLTTTIERNKQFTRTKEVLLDVFKEQMRTITEGEEATLNNREIIITAFADQLERVREDDLANLWDTCLKLVCRSRFSRSDAERILLGIERVKKENPHIPVREAAAISILEYLAWWMSTQMLCKAV